MGNLFDQLNNSLGAFFNQIAEFVPQILGALVILIVGWIIARILRFVVKKILKALKIDTLSEKAGIDDMLKKADFNFKLSTFLSKLVYWMIMLIVILTVLESLNLTTIKNLFNEIILFIPNVFVAILILLFGLYLAKIASKAISGLLKNMDAESVGLVEKIVYYSIIVFTMFIAIHQLGIAKELVETAFGLIFGAICLAIGIAFGLGGQDMAKDILKKLKK